MEFSKSQLRVQLVPWRFSKSPSFHLSMWVFSKSPLYVLFNSRHLVNPHHEVALLQTLIFVNTHHEVCPWTFNGLNVHRRVTSWWRLTKIMSAEERPCGGDLLNVWSETRHMSGD